jgi:hypothetical protein
LDLFPHSPHFTGDDWTQLCSFQALDMGAFLVAEESHQAPVILREHLIRLGLEQIDYQLERYRLACHFPPSHRPDFFISVWSAATSRANEASNAPCAASSLLSPQGSRRR